VPVSLAALVVLSALASLAATPASSHAQSPRLEGTWSVTLRDVYLRNVGDGSLLTVQRRCRFQPSCRGAHAT